jgi:putative endonuclease
MSNYNFYVYILTNLGKTVLYIGVTNDLRARLQQHFDNRGDEKTFAGKYHCYNLVYYEHHTYINNAIGREKELKKWNRIKKESLINEFNPEWRILNCEVNG